MPRNKNTVPLKDNTQFKEIYATHYVTLRQNKRGMRQCIVIEPDHKNPDTGEVEPRIYTMRGFRSYIKYAFLDTSYTVTQIVNEIRRM